MEEKQGHMGVATVSGAFPIQLERDYCILAGFSVIFAAENK